MIGLATIGQAPRDDVAPVMFSAETLPFVRQAGALDGLSPQDIAALQPSEAEHPLVTRLLSGEEVVIAKERVTPYLLQAVQGLEAAGAGLICVLCTGSFDLPGCSSRLVYPDRLIQGVVDGMLPSGRLGVVIPHAGQLASMQRKWGRSGRKVEIAVLSPYESRGGACVFDGLGDREVDLIVLDCMGYGRDVQDRAERVSRVPVILSNRLVGAVIESMTTHTEAR